MSRILVKEMRKSLISEFFHKREIFSRNKILKGDFIELNLFSILYGGIISLKEWTISVLRYVSVNRRFKLARFLLLKITRNIYLFTYYIYKFVILN